MQRQQSASIHSTQATPDWLYSGKISHLHSLVEKISKRHWHHFSQQEKTRLMLELEDTNMLLNLKDTNMSKNTLEIIRVDYRNTKQGKDLLDLLNAYALDEMGGQKALAKTVKQNLLTEMDKIPGAVSLLLYFQGNAIGLLNAFQGFSTFAGKPLINIHDLYIKPAFRGLGYSSRLLQKIEKIAQERGCCKLTLEVLQANKTAQGVYKKNGFSGYQLSAQSGEALFWQKKL